MLEIQFYRIYYTCMKMKYLSVAKMIINYIWFGVTLPFIFYVSWDIFIKFKDKDASDLSLVSSGGFVVCRLFNINNRVRNTGNAKPRKRAAVAQRTCSVICDFSSETKWQSKSFEFSHNLSQCSYELFMPFWITYHRFFSISHPGLSVQSHR